MNGYTKLFGSIVASTIWREPNPTRIVWITMLALANRFGVVEASMPGLADLAKVSIPECQEALLKLSSPDEYSRTKEHEGRRIKEVEGGWQILNYGKYRDKLSAEERKEYKRQWDREHRASRPNAEFRFTPDASDNPRQNPTNPTYTEAEAEAEAEAFKRSTPKPPRGISVLPACLQIPIPEGFGSDEFKKIWIEWITCRLKMKKSANPVLMFTKQLEIMKTWGEAGSILSMQASMANGWQGLFPPKGVNNNGHFEDDSWKVMPPASQLL